MENMNKAVLLEKVKEQASASEDFIMNHCGGMDLLMDAVTNSLEKMKKKELLVLWEIAKEDQYFVGEDSDEEEKK